MLPSACLPPCLSPGRGAGPPTVSRNTASTVQDCVCVCVCVRARGLCVSVCACVSLGASDLHAASEGSVAWYI